MNGALPKQKIIENMEQSLQMVQKLSSKSSMHNNFDNSEEFERITKKLSDSKKIFSSEDKVENVYSKNNGSFEWIDSKLIRAVQNGHWFLIDNANLLNASVLDRLNSLFEKDGTLVANERGKHFILFTW